MIALTSTETLFGGLLAVAALFSAARYFGLSNYWSGVLGGTLPFLAYLGYNTQVQQGGDMIAIHLAVFMATAAVMSVFGAIRKNKEQMHWAPKVIAGFFAGLVVFNAVLLTISSHGMPINVSGWFLPNPEKQQLHTAFPGVIPHDHNNLYEPHMQRIEAQRNLGWKLEVNGLDILRHDVPGTVTVGVQDAAGKAVVPDQVELALWRMANSADDKRLKLTPGTDGKFSGQLTLPDPGRWVIEINVSKGADTYVTQRSLTVDASDQK